MLPTFLVIGAAKCGTTSVCDILSEHPEVFVTTPKEPYFFVRDPLDEWLPWYKSLFDGAEGYEAAGEGSILYSHPRNVLKAAPRIRSMIPECRIVYMVRHPIRRLESDWKMRMIEGKDLGPIPDAVRAHPDLITIGCYWSHLSVYREYFPDDQILVVFLEDFARDPETEMFRILKHIGVEPTVPDSVDRKRNSTKARRRAKAVGDVERLIPGMRRLKPYVPEPVRELALRVLVSWKRPEPSVRWDAWSLRYVTERVRDDVEKLLAHFGKPMDFWELDDPDQVGR